MPADERTVIVAVGIRRHRADAALASVALESLVAFAHKVTLCCPPRCRRGRRARSTTAVASTAPPHRVGRTVQILTRLAPVSSVPVADAADGVAHPHARALDLRVHVGAPHVAATKPWTRRRTAPLGALTVAPAHGSLARELRAAAAHSLAHACHVVARARGSRRQDHTAVRKLAVDVTLEALIESRLAVVSPPARALDRQARRRYRGHSPHHLASRCHLTRAVRLDRQPRHSRFAVQVPREADPDHLAVRSRR